MPTPPGFKHSEESKRKISEGQRRYYRMKIEREPVPERVIEVADEKTCTGCGETKPIGEFYIKRRKMKCGLIHAYPEARCKQCRRERFKENYEKLKAEGKAKEKWERNAKQIDREKRREYNREWAAARRRKEGARSNGPWLKYREEGNGATFPIEPFANFLSGQVEIWGPSMLARETELDESRIRGWANAVEPRVSLRVIDQVLTKLGQPWRLHELYPAEDEKPLYGYFKP